MNWCEKRIRSVRIVKDYGPFYHPIRLPGFVFTRKISRETVAQWIRAERGNRKLNKFIRPMLPEGIKDKTVVEIGSNAGGNLIWCLKHGAKKCLGIEKDERYHWQALQIREAFGISWEKLDLVHADFFGEFPRSPSRHDFDYCLLLNVLYHLPDYERASVLRAAAWLARYVVVQGNGIGDELGGRGFTSLMELMNEAGLKLHSSHRENHCRGLVLVIQK